MVLILGVEKPVFGMIHLKPFPGAPFFQGNIEEIKTRAFEDARALNEGGVDGVIIENYGDKPFSPGRVLPHTISLMTIIAYEVKNKYEKLRVGINVLRNDAKAAMGIASALDLDFIRVNIHSGVMITPQGIIEGNAHDTLRYRRVLESKVEVFADVLVKHAVPVGNQTVKEAAKEMLDIGKTDAIIITGHRTGEEVDVNDIRLVKSSLETTPIIAGSGVDSSNIKDIFEYADGVIVGTSLKERGVTANKVDSLRVRDFMNIVEELR